MLTHQDTMVRRLSFRRCIHINFEESSFRCHIIAKQLYNASIYAYRTKSLILSEDAIFDSI